MAELNSYTVPMKIPFLEDFIYKPLPLGTPKDNRKMVMGRQKWVKVCKVGEDVKRRREKKMREENSSREMKAEERGDCFW